MGNATREIESTVDQSDMRGLGTASQRLVAPGAGKRGGYRVVLAARIGNRYVFLHGFPKSGKDNVSPEEHAVLQAAGKIMSRMSEVELAIRKWELGETRPAGPHSSCST